MGANQRIIVVAALLLASATGCAAHKPIKTTPIKAKANAYWRECSETLPAKTDGYQHFLCTTKDGRVIEVNVRPKPRT